MKNGFKAILSCSKSLYFSKIHIIFMKPLADGLCYHAWYFHLNFNYNHEILDLFFIKQNHMGKFSLKFCKPNNIYSMNKKRNISLFLITCINISHEIHKYLNRFFLPSEYWSPLKWVSNLRYMLFSQWLIAGSQVRRYFCPNTTILSQSISWRL